MIKNITSSPIVGLNTSPIKDITDFGISKDIRKKAANNLKAPKASNFGAYLGIASGALDLLGTGINNFHIPDYTPTDYGQFTSLESLGANAGNTSHLDIEGNNNAKDITSGAMTGVSAGMAFGPLGGVIGGIGGGLISGLTSIFGNKKKKREEERRYKDTFRRIEGQNVNIENKLLYNQIWNDVNYAKYGGFINNHNRGNKFEYGGSTLDETQVPPTLGAPMFLNYIKENPFFKKNDDRVKGSDQDIEYSPLDGLTNEEYSKLFSFIKKAENHPPGSKPVKINNEATHTTTYGLKRVLNDKGEWELANEKSVLNKKDAERMFNAYVQQEILTPLSKMYPNFEEFDSNIKLALIDGIYNVGITKFRNNSPKINKALSKYVENNLDPKYVNDVLKEANWGGKGAGGLAKRSELRQKGIMNWKGENIYKYGGKLKHHNNGIDFRTGYDKINSGGTHEENPFGGIPIGMDEEGAPNLVEEGEVIFNGYVFSNSLSAQPELIEELKLDKKYSGKTFAEIAEKINEEPSEREFDPISKVSLDDGLQKLLIAQEITKLMQQEQELESMEAEGNVFRTGGPLNQDNDPIDDLLKSIHELENPKKDPNPNEYGFSGNYQMGAESLAEVGVLTDEAKKEIKKAKTNKERNKIIRDPSKWKKQGDFKKFFGEETDGKFSGGDADFQKQLANKYIDVITTQLEFNLVMDYDDIKQKFGEENLIRAAWLGGVGNLVSFLKTGKTNLIESEHAEMQRRLFEGTSYAQDYKPEQEEEKDLVQHTVELPSERATRASTTPTTPINNPMLMGTDPSTIDREPSTTDKKSAPNKNKRSGLGGLNALMAAPIVSNAAGYVESFFEKPEVVKYDRVIPEKVSDRMEYQPINDDHINTQVANMYAGAQRGIMETTGGNRGLSHYGIMQNTKNASDAMYEAYYNTQRENLTRLERVKTFNAQINQFNSSLAFQAGQVNANIGMQESDVNARNRGAVRNYRNEMRNAFAENISGIAKQLRWEQLAPTIYGYDAQGNKIKQNQREG